jgi:hypothetical protein
MGMGVCGKLAVASRGLASLHQPASSAGASNVETAAALKDLREEACEDEFSHDTPGVFAVRYNRA